MRIQTSGWSEMGESRVMADAVAGGKVQCRQAGRACCGCGWARIGSKSNPLSDRFNGIRATILNLVLFNHALFSSLAVHTQFQLTCTPLCSSVKSKLRKDFRCGRELGDPSKRTLRCTLR